MSCELPTFAKPITQGAAWEFSATFKEAGVVLPITGALIEMELRLRPGDTDTVAVLSTANGRIVITDGPGGVAAYSLPQSVTDDIDRELYMQQYLTLVGGNRIPKGRAIVPVCEWEQS